MNYLKLLREDIDCQNFESIIEEATTGKKDYYIKGPMIVSETKNKNGRIYEASVIEREVNNILKKINERGRLGGELNHPQTPEINPERISHYITELNRQGNIWIGKAKVASTPLGSLIKNLIDDEYKIGMSTRGLGSVNEKGIVGSNYKLVTIDAVSDPSGPGCYMDSVVESRRFVVDESTGGIKEVIENVYDELEEDLSNLPKKSVFLEHHMQKAILKFLKSLK